MSARPIVSDADPLPIEVELRTVAEADGSFTGLCTAAVPHIFGGMLIGQSLAIAQNSVEPSRLPHSLHASFVDAGDGRMPIRYQVEETRSGGSFSSRRVVATLDGGVIFTLTASFQAVEDGPAYEVAATPGVASRPLRTRRRCTSAVRGSALGCRCPIRLRSKPRGLPT